MMREDEPAPQRATKDEKDVYWVRAGSDSLGIVVVIAWMLSTQRQVKKHADLHASIGWDSLVAHPRLVNLHSPPWARTLAIRVLDKLVQEVKERPRPIVFATFSGGLKSCLYQLFMIVDKGSEGVDPTLTKYGIVRDCYAGQIHDSSPIDFVSANGANFFAHPSFLGTKKKIPLITWSTHTVAKGLDFLFLPYFERCRAEMWDISYKTGAWGPCLVFCSKDDELAPWEVIQSFCFKMSSLGCKVTLIVWEKSRHVGHFKMHSDEYTSAVETFLSDAAGLLTRSAHVCMDGSQSPDIDGSITESVTSSSEFHQIPSTVRLESQTSNDGKVKVWISSRM